MKWACNQCAASGTAPHVEAVMLQHNEASPDCLVNRHPFLDVTRGAVVMDVKPLRLMAVEAKLLQ